MSRSSNHRHEFQSDEDNDEHRGSVAESSLWLVGGGNNGNNNRQLTWLKMSRTKPKQDIVIDNERNSSEDSECDDFLDADENLNDKGHPVHLLNQSQDGIWSKWWRKCQWRSDQGCKQSPRCWCWRRPAFWAPIIDSDNDVTDSPLTSALTVEKR